MFPKKEIKIPKIPMYSGLLPLFMAVLCEVLLYVWTMDTFVFGRFAAIAAFAAGFGTALAFLCGLLPPKQGKWMAVILAFLLVVVYIAEYLINDAFQNFMAPGTVQAGVGGVMTTYMSVVFDAITKNWWRILLLLLPLATFAVVAEPVKTGWPVRGGLAGLAVVLYLSAFGIVHGVGLDAARLDELYNFDSAVRSFGLNTALWLDLADNSGLVEEELSFEAPETLPAVTETEPPEQTQPEETAEPTEPAPVYGKHTMGVDFAALAETEKNANISALHSYIAGMEPSSENEYTGLFAGKNLIFITAEAFTSAVVDPELTPALYRLSTEGIRFTDYYQPMWGAGTTGGEYTNLVGQVPVDGGCMKEAQQQNLFMTIGNQLQEQGYSSAAFHNNSYKFYDRHETHTHLGYDYFMGYGNGMEQGISGRNWPQSDLEMIDYTVPMYIDKQPFSVYYMSVSGHSNYTVEANSMCAKNYDAVAHLDYSEPVKCYIAANLELEYALQSLLEQLEAAGIMDDTVIVVASDHFPYGLAPSSTWGTDSDELTELFGAETTDFIRDSNTLIIWSGAIEDMDIVVDTPTYSLDILPTLSNLFGLEFDSRLFVGRDVFSDQEPLVLWSVSGSWKTDKGSYLASEGTFTPCEGVAVDDSYVEQINAIVRNKVKYSKSTSNYNYFNYVYQALQARYETPSADQD